MRKLEKIKVRRLFDRHVHLREDDLMLAIALFTFLQANGAIIMPNLNKVINTIDRAREYEKQINALSGQEGVKFEPYLTYYLTDNTNIDELEEGFREGIWGLAKLYPKGATTNSEDGVTNIKNIYPVFERMQKIGMPLSLHGEETADSLSLYERERLFVKKTFPLLVQHFSELKIVMEHVSTKEGVDFVIENENVWATVTAHHLLKDKTVHGDDENELDPFYYCLPVLNSREDYLAIRKAVTSEDENIRKKFGAGTDSAPHLIVDKLGKNKPGIFTGLDATELYTQVFMEEGVKLEHLDDFLAVNLLEEVYGITPVEEYTTLIKEEHVIPQNCNGVRPFMAGETLQWRTLENAVRN